MTDTASKNAGFGGAGPENMLALAHGIAKAQADLKPTKLQSMICEAIRREFPDIDESCVKRLIQIFVEQMSRRMREF